MNTELRNALAYTGPMFIAVGAVGIAYGLGVCAAMVGALGVALFLSARAMR